MLFQPETAGWRQKTLFQSCRLPCFHSVPGDGIQPSAVSHMLRHMCHIYDPVDHRGGKFNNSLQAAYQSLFTASH